MRSLLVLLLLAKSFPLYPRVPREQRQKINVMTKDKKLMNRENWQRLSSDFTTLWFFIDGENK